jgi:plasmid stabilization system protein ParE
MPTVVVTLTARDDLERLVQTHSLPDDTTERFRRSIVHLGRFPSIGAELHGAWDGFRFVLGPWRWMIVVYEFVEAQDQVVIVTVQDARSGRSPTSTR